MIGAMEVTERPLKQGLARIRDTYLGQKDDYSLYPSEYGAIGANVENVGEYIGDAVGGWPSGCILSIKSRAQTFAIRFCPVPVPKLTGGTSMSFNPVAIAFSELASNAALMLLI